MLLLKIISFIGVFLGGLVLIESFASHHRKDQGKIITRIFLAIMFLGALRGAFLPL